MRNRSDFVAKEIGKAALRPFGKVVAQAEITTETQYADLRHEPDPAHVAGLAELGLLGRFAAHACLIEAYSEAPGPGDFRACLAKHLAFWQQRVRDAERGGQVQPPEDVVAPFLWIIAAGVPTTLLTTLKPAAAPPPDWPRGTYFFGGNTLRVGIIVASELPRDLSTLLVRIMAAGPLLAPAVKEVAALSPTAPVRVIAEPVLLQLQHNLRQEPNPAPDEKEFIMAMIKSWEEARAEGRADALLTVLHARGIAVSDAVRERILAQRDPERLKRWLEKAIVASSIGEVIDDPS